MINIHLTHLFLQFYFSSCTKELKLLLLDYDDLVEILIELFEIYNLFKLLNS